MDLRHARARSGPSRQSQSVSVRWSSNVSLAELLRELDHFAFRPTAIIGRVAVALSKECAVATVLGFDIDNVAIGKDLLPRLRQQPNERIVGGMDHERWPNDAVDP